MGVADFVVFRAEEAAEVRADAEDVEVIAGHEPDADHLAAVFADQARRLDDLASEAGQHGIPVAQSQVERVRKGMSAIARLRAEAAPLEPELDELTGVAYGKKPQQDLIDQSEDRGVGPNAKSERQRGDSGEHRGFQQRTQGKTHFRHTG